MKSIKFINPEQHYIDEFFRICRFIAWSYNKFLTDKVKLSKKHETFLRNVFVKKYLREFKHIHGLGYLGFEVEPGEINYEDKTIGFIDIKIYNIGNPNILNEDEYYAIECKRLDGTNTKNLDYVDEGILRFVILKYSSSMPLAAMIGFVETKKISDVVVGINHILKNHKRIVTNQMLTPKPLTEDFDQFYSSSHKRKRNLINLYHFMFDYTTLRVSNGKKG